MRRAFVVVFAWAALVGVLTAAEPIIQWSPDAAEAIRTKVTRPQVEASLAHALARYSLLAHVKIAVDWDKLKPLGVAPETKVAIRAPEATVEQLLDLTLAKASPKGKPLAWYIRDNIVHVTTQAGALKREVLATGFAVAAPMPSARGPLVKRRARTMPIVFEATSLSDVIDYFGQLTGLTFHVNWRSLEIVGITRDAPVTLRVQNISLAKAMNMILDDVSELRSRFDRAYWVIDEGIIQIATGSALDTHLTTRVVDVTDLLISVPDMPGRPMGLPQTSTGTTGTSSGSGTQFSGVSLATTGIETQRGTGPPTRQEREQRLIDAIKDSIGDEMWQPIGKGSISIIRGQMIISQTRLGFKLLEKVL